MICKNCHIETDNFFEFAGDTWCEDCIKDVHTIPTEEQRYKKFVQKFRTETIPPRYNQVKLLDELANPNIDHYISISNRTDGKTFNYIRGLLNIGIEYDIGISFFSRNMMLRLSYQQLIEEIIEKAPEFERNDFSFVRQQYYIALNYNGKTIAFISDLNNATELKYFSSYIKQFPIMVYDEFLALSDDYLTDEWDRLKTIYESIDRVADRPLIIRPKIFYLGNAVNFDSPILHGLKIFNILERHPINTAKIYNYDYNVMLEMNRNESANEQRNTRAFDSLNDSMTTAQFQTNDHNIATDGDRLHVKRNPRVIFVKLRNEYLKIWFNRNSMMTILSIESRIDEPYQYNLLLKDNRPDSVFLKDGYFDEEHIKKIDKGAYLFENNFSKNHITDDSYDLNRLKINKLMREYLRSDNEQVEMEQKEKQFTDNFLEQTKKGIMQKLWG